MGATNTTANYNLSQFIGTDKPAWLQDYNGDMLKIDTGINAAKVAADGAQNAASAAQNDANTANNAITNTINPAIAGLNTTVGNQAGAINTIQSLIGNGTPTTTDQTIIGAINELHADITGTVSGNSLATLLTAVGNLTEAQKDKCVIVVNSSYRLRRHRTDYFDDCMFDTASGSFESFRLSLSSNTFKHVTIPSSFTPSASDITITSWVIYKGE